GKGARVSTGTRYPWGSGFSLASELSESVTRSLGRVESGTERAAARRRAEDGLRRRSGAAAGRVASDGVLPHSGREAAHDPHVVRLSAGARRFDCGAVAGARRRERSICRSRGTPEPNESL